MGDSITKMGQKWSTFVTAPLVGAGVAMMKTFADFEAVMTEIGARTGATAEEMKQMNDLAIKMGRDTKFSATQAAEALLELTSSGQSAKQAMATLEPVLHLAAAGNIELGRAADGVTDILAQYQLGVKESAVVTDILTKAAGASSATVESMIQAFGNVGPVAAAFNISVADTAAALAVLHENGTKGAEAGTALKSMLTNMNRNTESAAEAWATLGVSMYDAQGNMKNIDDLFKEINVAMEDMSMKEQSQITQDLAGTYGMLAFNSLRVANGTSEMRNQMHAAAGAEEVAAAMSKTLAGRWDALMSSIETLSIVLGQLAAGPLGDFLGWITDCINAFSSWAEVNPQLAQTVLILLAIVAAVGPLLIILGQLMSAWAVVSAGFASFAGFAAGFGAIVAMITSPLGILIGAIILVIAIFNDWMGIRSALMSFFSWLVGAIYGLGDVVSNVGGMIAEGWGKIWYHLVENAKTLASQLLQIFMMLPGKMMDVGRAIASGLLNGIIEGFKQIVIWILAKVNELVTKIRSAFGIASPSKVMAKIGEQVVQGFNKGIEGMGGIGVNVPQVASSPRGNPSLSYAGAGASGGGNNITNNFYLPPGSDEQTYQYIKKRMGDDAKRKGAKPIK